MHRIRSPSTFLRSSCMSFGHSAPYAVVQCLCAIWEHQSIQCVFIHFIQSLTFPSPLLYWKRREGQNGRNDHTGCIRDTCWLPGTFSHRCYRRFCRRIFRSVRSWSAVSAVARSPLKTKLPRDLFRKQSRSRTLHTGLQNFYLTQMI